MAESFMQSVTTISNNKIKEIQKLHLKKYREESGLFLAEGIKAVLELLNENVVITELFATKTFENIKNQITIIDEKIMKKISTTDSAPEVVAIGYQPKQDKNVLKTSKE